MLVMPWREPLIRFCPIAYSKWLERTLQPLVRLRIVLYTSSSLSSEGTEKRGVAGASDWALKVHLLGLGLRTPLSMEERDSLKSAVWMILEDSSTKFSIYSAVQSTSSLDQFLKKSCAIVQIAWDPVGI